MYVALSLFILSIFTIYLLTLFNKELHDKYCWTKEIEYVDYVNLRKLKVLGSTETFTVSSMNSLFESNKLIADIEYTISDFDNILIPFKSMILGYITEFYSNKNIMSLVTNTRDIQVSLFSKTEKLDIPSFFIGKNIYNIFINYQIYTDKSKDPIKILSEKDYEIFLSDLYKFKKDFTCKVQYTAYKQVGKDEMGEKIFDLFLITNLGPSYNNINYGQQYITQLNYIE